MSPIDAQNSDHISTKFFSPDHDNIQYSGRIDRTDAKTPKLISAGAYIKLNFKGNNCTLLLSNQYEDPGYNYLSVELDGEYKGRVQVTKDQAEYKIAKDLSDDTHTLLLCKATEAENGFVGFRGVRCEDLLPIGDLPERKIEFIGNSITCGAEMDTTDYSCDSAQYHDHHNAYLAYGPVLARILNADWVLSAVSGRGLTRNWNNEGPPLPALYDNLYLDTDSSYKWKPDAYTPQLVTVCLGTNDNSEGDGSYDRKELDAERFINAYIDFIRKIRKRYPDAKICLINSPVFEGITKDKFEEYLSQTIDYLKTNDGDQNLSYFSFSRQYNNGCSGHPSLEDHRAMTNELLPFIRKLMNW